MKPLAYASEAKSETEILAIKLNAPRDRLVNIDGSSKLTPSTSRTKQKNDLNQWRKNITLIRQRTEFSNAI